MVPSSLRSKGMPKCSSSMTTSGAVRHMNSMASWSPSQSDPLMVSYICHCQESGPILPSAAPTPPCAATVCERVGKTLDSTATRMPASDNCSAARKPAPPAPTTTASNCRTTSFVTLAPPHDLHGPGGITAERHHDGGIERQPQAGRPGIVHEDVPHAHPGVVAEAQKEQQRDDPHPAGREQRPPLGVVFGVKDEQRHNGEHGVHRHDHRGQSLPQPLGGAVMRADDTSLRACHHNSTHPKSSVSARLAPSTARAEARADCRSMPTCRSSNRCRMPAQK